MPYASSPFEKKPLLHSKKNLATQGRPSLTVLVPCFLLFASPFILFNLLFASLGIDNRGAFVSIYALAF